VFRLKKIVEVWNKLKLWQQVLLIVAILAIAFSVFFVSTKPSEYNLLFSELDAKEAIQIGNELATMGVDYTLQESNTTIMVKTPDVASIRMKLASKGLPSVSGSGFELFDATQLGSNSFQNDVNYTRAVTTTIENTLKKGIDHIDNVELQMPLIEKKRFYEQDDKDTPLTAKVIVNEKAGYTLTASQVKGIQNFVAGASKSLTPENVTVLNGSGEVISENGDSDTSSSSSASYSKQEEIKNKMETRINQDITKTLSSVFGYDNIKLTVRADINFDKIVQNIEKYDPKGTLVSSQKNTEKSQSKSQGDKEAGTESNGDVNDYELSDGTNGDVSTSEKENIIENFEVGKTVETIQKNPELQNILVSVYVDETQISKSKMADLKESIASSAGLIDKDGDGVYDNGVVTVKAYEFHSNKEAEKQTVDTTPSVKTFLNDNKVFLMIIIGMLIVVIILTLLLALTSSRKKRAEEAEETLNESFKAVDSPRAANAYASQEEGEEDVPLSKEEIIRQKTLEETIKYAKQDMDKTVDFIKKEINGNEE